jgi:hypothetical protein
MRWAGRCSNGWWRRWLAQLDGAYNVRRYGRSGQAQHGLDIVGFFTGRLPTIYQAKDWQQFGASDLEVIRWQGGRRPLGLAV